MIYALRTFLRFLRTRTTKDWRLHRTACRALLPASEKRDDAEGGS